MSNIRLEKRELVYRLERLGVDSPIANRIVAILPLLEKIFPEPGKEEIRKAVTVVGKNIWAKHVWNGLMEKKTNKESHFEQLAEQLVTDLISSGLWPLLSYLTFKIKDFSIPAGARAAVSPEELERIHMAKVTKLNQILIGKEAAHELQRLEPTLVTVMNTELKILDHWALDDSQFRELVNALHANGLDINSPSRLLFEWVNTDPEIQLSLDEANAALGNTILPKVQDNVTPDIGYAIVRVFFATDRNRTKNGSKPKNVFGNNRSSALSYGFCDVSIPRDHRMGEIESPSIWKLEIREDPNKHVVVLRAIPQSKDQYFADIVKRVSASPSSSAFLFVHGYNVSFEDAARRTAQIAYDLGFEGAPVFYSWPSQGTTSAYLVDEQNIEWTQPNLKTFLEEFFFHSDAQCVYIIAHSMGNRALTRAVASLLAEKPSLKERLKEVILTAPDIDADVFKRDIAPALAASGRPITLYASKNDIALLASKKVHGSPRAGDSGQGLIVLSPIETVDASDVDTSLLGHSYFAESRSVLSDIFYIIRNNQRADSRFGLSGINTKEGRYWVFKQ